MRVAAVGVSGERSEVRSMAAALAPFFAPREESGGVPVAKLNCAGHGCADRESCRRWLVMVPAGKRIDAGGGEHPNYEWASFDVERQRFGTCSAFAVVAQARGIR